MMIAIPVMVTIGFFAVVGYMLQGESFRLLGVMAAFTLGFLGVAYGVLDGTEVVGALWQFCSSICLAVTTLGVLAATMCSFFRR